MQNPFISNNSRINSATLLARLRIEMQRPVSLGQESSKLAGPQTVPEKPARRGTPSFLGFILKVLRWGKSLLHLQDTRFKVYKLEEVMLDGNSQILRQEGVLREQQQELSALRFEQRDGLAVLKHRLDLMAREIAFQQSRLNRTIGLVQSSATGIDNQAQVLPMSDRLDSLFLSFEDAFRGSREDILGRVSYHLEKFSLAGAGRPDKPILDLGCGRGEWLQALRDNGYAARGIDLNTCNIELCRQLGLDVAHTDAISALRACPDNSLSGVTAFHLVEHLPFETVVELIDEALRVLCEGGILLLETPNPESLMVSGRNFFFDPTHRQPIPPPVLSFVLERRGFVSVTIDRLHPYGREHHLDASQGQAESLLNELLFGPQDYAVIGRKP
jgi:SAM-dependent methyltransferase